MSQVLYDVTHTSHTNANTGIQRVIRRLHRHWPKNKEPSLLPVVHDKYAHAWRRMDADETDNLMFTADKSVGERRGASWSLSQRIRGRVSRVFPKKKYYHLSKASGFICGELFLDECRLKAFSQLKTELPVTGPRVAIFHDMIAVQSPELAPRATVAKYHTYLERLLSFDIIASVSDYSRDCLVSYWKSKSIAQIPQITTIPLGVDEVAGATSLELPYDKTPMILSVGTLEGRKNHVALLEACELLWTKGLHFRLRLIGMLNKETGVAAMEKIQLLKAKNRQIEWYFNASDEFLKKSYKECIFTVYPSLCEGFGLPVLESLAHGRACVCSGLTAMAEVAAGGGCVLTGEPNSDNIARGIESLLVDQNMNASLSTAAMSRNIRTWDDYALDLHALLANGMPGGVI
ncbi:glycosyltransferase involved in cell wall biosynthesis [Ereboglobus sp. PH5-10]|uniref:glycosyltransferase n=1 Tax=Ereboglobus sp. PH5-10 TaxID=2940629 RepID=UPI00240757EC|nr:glycosyltransferase [Ereboglobus sp. PH5-10]MDF9828231.1 glycosyltransferase involved in cell wall biosynthesis [Ereboglobus sp. PH5-10]